MRLSGQFFVCLVFFFWKKKKKRCYLLCFWNHGVLVVVFCLFCSYFSNSCIALTLFRIGFFGAGHGWERGKKAATHTLQWWNLAQLYLTQRRSKKYMNNVTQPLISADINIFYRKSANFAISRNKDIDCILILNFYFF